MSYRESETYERQIVEGIEIKDRGVVEKTATFEKGRLRLTATDHDGWADLMTWVARWNDEKRAWEDVVRERPTADGKADYSLGPGVYQLRMSYAESETYERQVVEGIEIKDRGVVEKEAYFAKGRLRLTATDHDGWADVMTWVARWNDEKRSWDDVIRERRTTDGKADYSLGPGVYQLRMSYREAEPAERRVVEGIRIEDRQAQSLGEMFGGGNLPPLLSIGGPFEIGDGDGYYEVGEKVAFRVDVRDSDLEGVEFLVNGRVSRRVDQVGRFEQLLVLSVPGECRFSVRAKDRRGTLESFACTLPINMARERPPRAARHLPPGYGGPTSQGGSRWKCPRCDRAYDGAVSFCAQDGTRLEPVSGVVNRVLDAGLRAARVDPATSEAAHAKRLGLDWLNPFVGQDRLDQDFQRLVDDIVGK